MRRMKVNFDKFHWANLPKVAVVAILLAVCFPARSTAQQPGQKTFSSAEEASHALVTAMQSNDEKVLLEILGPDGKQIVSSGDETEDTNNRANFVKRYEQMHRLVKEPDGTVTLYIGPHNWPTPIPLVNKGHSWYFDTEAGKKKKFCTGELAGMNYRRSAFARNWWGRKRNTPRSTRSTPRKSSVMKGSMMASIGKRRRANRRAPSDRWWQRPLPRVLAKA